MSHKADLIDQIKKTLTPRPWDYGLSLGFVQDINNENLFYLSGRPDIVEPDKLMTEDECIQLVKRLKPEVYRTGRYRFYCKKKINDAKE